MLERPGQVAEVGQAGQVAEAAHGGQAERAGVAGQAGRAARAGQGERPRSLRVVSANLRNGKADPKALLAMLEAVHADAVVLQEAAPHSFDALSAVFPHGTFEPQPDHTALGIALRRPASFARIPIAWRDARVATLRPAEWPELTRELDIVNVHIAAPHVYKPPLYGFVLRYQQVRALENHFGGPGVNHRSSASRGSTSRLGSQSGAQPDTHASTQPGTQPSTQPRSTLLLGDFNATPLWPAYRRISSQFTDVSVAVAQRLGRPSEPTWAPRPEGRRRLRIDHAFSRGLSPEEFQVAPIEGSDHSAIVVDVAALPVSSEAPKKVID